MKEVLEDWWDGNRELTGRPRELAINRTANASRGYKLNCRDLYRRPLQIKWRMLWVLTSRKPKAILVFIRNKRQEASGVSELVNKDEFLQSNTTAKTVILNEQFHSIRKKICTILDKGLSPHPSMHEIRVNPNSVKKLLKDLKPYKASGRYGIPNYILRAAVEKQKPRSFSEPTIPVLFGCPTGTYWMEESKHRSPFQERTETPTCKLQTCITYLSLV